MAEIVLARVDTKLIHTAQAKDWMEQMGVQRAVIIDDDLKNDPFVQSVFQRQIPQGVHLLIVGTEQAAGAYQFNGMGIGRVALFFREIKAAWAAKSRGLKIAALQVARTKQKQDTLEIIPEVYLDETNALRIKHLEDTGTEVYFQNALSDKKIRSEEKIKNFFPEIYK